MENLIEIRWHGRGGQGAKTASLLLADAAFNTRFHHYNFLRLFLDSHYLL